MQDLNTLLANIREKRSLLCVGLDSDLSRLPAGLSRDAAGVLAFNKAIIDATLPYAVAYKPNLAFYERLGPAGMQVFADTVSYIGERAYVVADAKRGDIGNTARQYAKAFFEHYGVDALTLSPYMGRDTVEPYMDYKDKLLFVLALTSNPGAQDYEYIGEPPLWEQVIASMQNLAGLAEIGFVVGATRPDDFNRVRQLAPEAWLLVPGIGAQGGDLAGVLRNGLGPAYNLLINSSRSILFASDGEAYAQAAARAAKRLVEQMREHVAFDR